MEKSTTRKENLQLIGIQVRTNNSLEMDPSTGKIGPTVQTYFHQGLAEKIPHRKHPGTTLCAYTDYESDHTGDYTYFIGEEVTSLNEVPEGLTTLIIPAQTYTKFTNGPGTMPDVVREPWMKIWEMSSDELGGTRSYITDFEVYDSRAADHSNVVLDIYIGLN